MLVADDLTEKNGDEWSDPVEESAAGRFSDMPLPVTDYIYLLAEDGKLVVFLRWEYVFVEEVYAVANDGFTHDIVASFDALHNGLH